MPKYSVMILDIEESKFRKDKRDIIRSLTSLVFRQRRVQVQKEKRGTKNNINNNNNNNKAMFS